MVQLCRARWARRWVVLHRCLHALWGTRSGAYWLQLSSDTGPSESCEGSIAQGGHKEVETAYGDNEREREEILSVVLNRSQW